VHYRKRRRGALREHEPVG